jgi:DNA replication protein DnaC
MTNETTINKLIEMRLTAMADAYRRQIQDISLDAFSFEDRMGLLVDIEYTSRKNNKLKRLIRDVGLDQPHAGIANINCTAGRRLNKAQIDKLTNCDYISHRHNIIIMGASDAGKSYLAYTYGMEAYKQFYSVKYVRLPELFTKLAIARGEGVYKKVLHQYRKVNLLILDEWIFVSLTETEARDVLELIHARHRRASTVFCSQFSPAGWHAKIGEATLTDAILDRIVHDSHNIEIHNVGSDYSMREVYGINGIK